MKKKRRIIVGSSDEDSDNGAVQVGTKKSRLSPDSTHSISRGQCKEKHNQSLTTHDPAKVSRPKTRCSDSAHAVLDPAPTLATLVKTGRRPPLVSTLPMAKESLYESSLSALSTPNFTSISANIIAKLFRLIDTHLFFNCIGRLLKIEGRTVSFRVSNRMTRRAGQLLTDNQHPRRHELSISTHLLFQTFSDMTAEPTRPITVNGVSCTSRLHCLLSIIEHEMVHLLLCCVSFRDVLFAEAGGAGPEKGCVGGAVQGEGYHGHTFQQAAKRICGHTEWQHDLVTTDEIAFKKHGINVGATVRFTSVNEGSLVGQVNRVQKRVTVLVKEKTPARPHSDAREFSDGNYYRKFYVPVSECVLVKEEC